MAKRKYIEAFTPVSDNPRRTSRHRRLIALRITEGQNSLARAIKLAKGLERQKLGRRSKVASAKDETTGVTRVESEIHALKYIDPLHAARKYLNKTLLRIKTIAESGLLPDSVKEEKAVVRDAHTVNVMARLWNASPIKESMNIIVDDIRNLVKAEEAATKDGTKPYPQQINLHERSQEQDSTDVYIEEAKIGSHESSQYLEGGQPFESGCSEDVSVFDERLGILDEAGNSRDVDDDEDGNGSDIHKKKTSARWSEGYGGKLVSHHGPEPKLFPAISSPPSLSGSTYHVSKSPAIGFKPTDSTFLTSLTMSGYWSGSEEASDIEEEVAPRKNRRGQRARQRIAELKFGSKAKHLQGREEIRNSGRDSMKGAISNSGRREQDRKPDFTRPRNGGIGRNGETSTEKSNFTADAGRLHPSWEAAKKRNEEKATASFQGKRLVFD